MSRRRPRRSTRPADGAAPTAPTRDGIDDWSVLSRPDDLPAELRSALLALGRERRAAISRSIGKTVLREIERATAPWFSAGLHDHARADVYGARQRGAEVALFFVADHDNYNFAQSGSDWDDHYVYAGEAQLVDGKLADGLTTALERHVHLTEHEHEDYRPLVTRDLVRDELRGRLAAGLAPPPPGAAGPVEAELERVRASSVERARAANARSAPEPPTLTARCPRCGAVTIHREPLFDAYQLACTTCRHSEIFETYPDRDSDDHWFVAVPPRSPAGG